ncbi:hypothetical protein [Nocardia fluminea]|uniref:hypothetical protein n=1 Tax=Nocardia fluminea TaxID=134984 RepID=UPI003D09E743
MTGPPGAGKTTVSRLLAGTATAPTVLPWFRALADHGGPVVSYVVLRPDLTTTVSRAQQRVGDELKDLDAISGLRDAFSDIGDLEKYTIDTGGLDPNRTADRTRLLLATGSHRLT